MSFLIVNRSAEHSTKPKTKLVKCPDGVVRELKVGYEDKQSKPAFIPSKQYLDAALDDSQFYAAFDLNNRGNLETFKENTKASGKVLFRTNLSQTYTNFHDKMGLTDVPRTFKYLLKHCFGDMHLKECVLFNDDIFLFTDTHEELSELQEEVKKRMVATNLISNIDKIIPFHFKLSLFAKTMGHMETNEQEEEVDEDTKAARLFCADLLADYLKMPRASRRKSEN